MLDQWLSETISTPAHGLYSHIEVVEIKSPDQNIINMLGKEVISSYRDLEFLKYYYSHKTQAELIDYLNEYVLPDDDNQISKNVEQGDFAEIFASNIVAYFRNLNVPIKKMRWKFNKNKSVFSTDMLAHNEGDIITDLYYYEIKSRQDTSQREGKNPNRYYVAVIAHNGLFKEQEEPTEAIADFLSKYYFEKNDYEASEKYQDIVLNPSNYNKHFEVFLLIDKQGFNAAILDELEELPPALSPLCVTVVLIENMRSLISEVRQSAIHQAIEFVFAS